MTVIACGLEFSLCLASCERLELGRLLQNVSVVFSSPCSFLKAEKEQKANLPSLLGGTR